MVLAEALELLVRVCAAYMMESVRFGGAYGQCC